MAAGILRQVGGARARHLARLGLEQAGGDQRQRRLAHAVRAGQRDDLPTPHLERRALEHDAIAVGEAHVAHAADDIGRVRQVERPVLCQPNECLLARCVEHDAAVVHEENTVDVSERARGSLLGDEYRTRQLFDQVEERVGGLGVELRRRLVEQQQLRLERKRGRERHALQLAPGELTGRAVGEVRRTDRSERLLDARPDLRRLDADVLEAEGDLVRDIVHHDLVLGILEDGRDYTGELRGPRLARVEPGNDDAPVETATVEVRHEAGERAQQRRLAGAGRAEQRDVLTFGDLERDVVEHRWAARVGEAQVIDGR